MERVELGCHIAVAVGFVVVVADGGFVEPLAGGGAVVGIVVAVAGGAVVAEEVGGVLDIC